MQHYRVTQSELKAKQQMLSDLYCSVAERHVFWFQTHRSAAGAQACPLLHHLCLLQCVNTPTHPIFGTVNKSSWQSYLVYQQGDHLYGKPGNANEFDRVGVPRTVREMSVSLTSGDWLPCTNSSSIKQETAYQPHTISYGTTATTPNTQPFYSQYYGTTCVSWQP